jgi:hypothetical protein
MFACVAASVLTISALGADSLQTIDMEGKKAQFPITYDPAQKEKIRELHLYVSEDGGASWRKHLSAKPSANFFEFEASKYGVFSFALVIEYVDGRVDQDVSNLKPVYNVRFASVSYKKMVFDRRDAEEMIWRAVRQDGGRTLAQIARTIDKLQLDMVRSSLQNRARKSTTCDGALRSSKMCDENSIEWARHSNPSVSSSSKHRGRVDSGHHG